MLDIQTIKFQSQYAEELQITKNDILNGFPIDCFLIYHNEGNNVVCITVPNNAEHYGYQLVLDYLDEHEYIENIDNPTFIFNVEKDNAIANFKEKYRFAKSNVYIESHKTVIETGYSVENIQSMLTNEIKADKFPTTFITFDGQEFEIKNKKEAEDISAKIAQELRAFWNKHFKPNQEALRKCKTLKELHSMAPIVIENFYVTLEKDKDKKNENNNLNLNN